MGTDELQPPTSEGSWKDGPRTGLSMADKDRNGIQDSPSKSTGLDPLLMSREGLRLLTAGAGDWAPFQAKRKSHLGKTQESYFVEL